MKRMIYSILSGALMASMLSACSGGGEKKTNETAAPMEIYKPKEKASPLGVGPITSEVTLGELDPAMAAEGEKVFSQLCTACHKLEKRHVGPALGDVLERRNAAWVMNMILNPEVMVKEDPVAKELFAEYLSPMANQNLTEEQARSVVEYIRQSQSSTN